MEYKEGTCNGCGGSLPEGSGSVPIGRDKNNRIVYSHNIVYCLMKGPIPDHPQKIGTIETLG